MFRVASEYPRKQARAALSSSLESMPAVQALGASPEANALANESLILVQCALDSLDIEKRAVFVLHELEDMAAREIAEALGVRLNTVYSRLRLARLEFERAIRRMQLAGWGVADSKKGDV